MRIMAGGLKQGGLYHDQSMEIPSNRKMVYSSHEKGVFGESPSRVPSLDSLPPSRGSYD